MRSRVIETPVPCKKDEIVNLLPIKHCVLSLSSRHSVGPRKFNTQTREKVCVSFMRVAQYKTMFLQPQKFWKQLEKSIISMDLDLFDFCSYSSQWRQALVCLKQPEC